MNTNTQQPALRDIADHNSPPPFSGHRWWDWGAFWRRALIIMLVAVVLGVVRWLAYQLRFDFDVPLQYRLQFASHGHWVIALQLVCLFIAGQFSGIYRYFSIPDILRLAYAMMVSAALLYAIRLEDIGFSPPRGVILVQSLLGFVAIGGMRSAWRVVHEKGRL